MVKRLPLTPVVVPGSRDRPYKGLLAQQTPPSPLPLPPCVLPLTLSSEVFQQNQNCRHDPSEHSFLRLKISEEPRFT